MWGEAEEWVGFEGTTDWGGELVEMLPLVRVPPFSPPAGAVNRLESHAGTGRGWGLERTAHSWGDGPCLSPPPQAWLGSGVSDWGRRQRKQRTFPVWQTVLG